MAESSTSNVESINTTAVLAPESFQREKLFVQEFAVRCCTLQIPGVKYTAAQMRSYENFGFVRVVSGFICIALQEIVTQIEHVRHENQNTLGPGDSKDDDYDNDDDDDDDDDDDENSDDDNNNADAASSGEDNDNSCDEGYDADLDDSSDDDKEENVQEYGDKNNNVHDCDDDNDDENEDDGDDDDTDDEYDDDGDYRDGEKEFFEIFFDLFAKEKLKDNIDEFIVNDNEDEDVDISPYIGLLSEFLTR